MKRFDPTSADLTKIFEKYDVQAFELTEDHKSLTVKIVTDKIAGLGLRQELRELFPPVWSLEFGVIWENEVSIPEKKSVEDVVNHPSHYNSGKIEVIEFIEDQKLCYHLGNSVKYISRAGKKDPTKELEDLKKASWYLQRKIEELKAQKENRLPLRPNQMVKA